MGHAYIDLLADRDEIRFQMQAHAAAGDPELGDSIRRDFTGLWEDVKRLSGASDERGRRLHGQGDAAERRGVARAGRGVPAAAAREQL